MSKKPQNIVAKLHSLVIILFHLLFLITPFVFTWVNDELFEFNKMITTYALTTLIAGVWVTRMIVAKKLILKRTPLDIPLALFFISQVLSTIFSIHPRTSFLGYYTRFHGGLLSSITYLTLFYAFVSNVEKKHLRSLLLTLFIAALGISLYALPEHFGFSPSCLLIAGQLNADCWIQDVQTRVFGTFGQPNWLAAYAITLIPLGLALISSKFTMIRRNQDSSRLDMIKKIFYYLTTFFLFTVLLFTKSRSGFVGLVVALAIYFSGYLIINLKTQNLKNFAPRFFLFIVSFLLLSLIFGTPFTPSLSQLARQNRPSTTSALSETDDPTEPSAAVVINRLEAGGTDSGEIRKIVWTGAIRVWQRYPLLGSGVETFAYSYYQDRPVEHNLVSEWDFLYNRAHNEWLNFLATTGIIGLGTYLLFIGWYLVLSVKQILKKSPDLKLIPLALLSGIIALSISNFFGFSTVVVTTLFFLYPAFFVVLTSKDSSDEDLAERPSSLAFSQHLGISIVSIISIFLLFASYNTWSADSNYALGKGLAQANFLTEGTDLILVAIRKSPNEALYYDKLADIYTRAAINLEQSGNSTGAAQVAQAAIVNSSKALELNPRHLNFHKTRARVLITLAQLDLQLLGPAAQTLQTALALSPTDAKLMYNLALVQLSSGQAELALQTLEQTVSMRANYEAARQELANQYQIIGETEKARKQYEYILQNLSPNNQLVKEKLDSL